MITESAINPFRFVGKLGYYYDLDLSKYLLRARFYDAAAIRFLSRDPLAHGPSDLNAYRYAFANPVANADPSGLWIQWVIGGVVGVIVIGGVIYYICSRSCAKPTSEYAYSVRRW